MASILKKGKNYSVDNHFESVLREEIKQNQIKYVVLGFKNNIVKAFVNNNTLMYQREVNKVIEFSTNILFREYDYEVKGDNIVVSIIDFEFEPIEPNHFSTLK